MRDMRVSSSASALHVDPAAAARGKRANVLQRVRRAAACAAGYAQHVYSAAACASIMRSSAKVSVARRHRSCAESGICGANERHANAFVASMRKTQNAAVFTVEVPLESGAQSEKGVKGAQRYAAARAAFAQTRAW